jgi:hypothetical protein
MTLLPRSSSEVVVRCDLYAKEGYQVPTNAVERWKWMLEKELTQVPNSDDTRVARGSYFAYKCGGK